MILSAPAARGGRANGMAAAAAAFAFALVPPAHAVEPQKPYGELTPRPMWIEKVKDGLYVIRGPLGICMGPCVPNSLTPDGVLHEPGDVAVRVTPKGVIIVDDKFARDVPEVLRLIKTVTDQPVKYVLNSHYHQDHVGGNGEMIKYGATIVANDALRAAYDRTKPGGDSPQVTFGDDGAIYLGGVKVEMHHFGRGHTLGDTFVYFPDLRVVHTGDVVVEGMPHIDYKDGGSAVGWVAEIYDLLKLDFDWAIPGHGRLLTKDEVRQYVKNVEIMNARMKELVRQGVPKDQAGRRLKLDDLGWAKSASTSTFMANDIPGYYDEMAAVLAAERKAGAPG
jgi:glyoxylase-like metal-dependent hydrolase (beta-lactamase superfamily II)